MGEVAASEVTFPFVSLRFPSLARSSGGDGDGLTVLLVVLERW